MAKQSAGILVYRQRNHRIEVLIVHPGGPFWRNKDKGAWSIPKGEYESDDALTAAKREFHEELGKETPSGELVDLGAVKNKSGKIVQAWAVEGDLDVKSIKSNTFTMQWPPKSGKEQEFPEVDKAGWFDPETAVQKLNPYQAPFVERLAETINYKLDIPQQTTLL